MQLSLAESETQKLTSPLDLKLASTRFDFGDNDILLKLNLLKKGILESIEKMNRLVVSGK